MRFQYAFSDPKWPHRRRRRCRPFGEGEMKAHIESAYLVSDYILRPNMRFQNAFSKFSHLPN